MLEACTSAEESEFRPAGGYVTTRFPKETFENVHNRFIPACREGVLSG